MAKLTTPEKANRLARAIASDIAAYNDAAITRALAEDSRASVPVSPIVFVRERRERADQRSGRKLLRLAPLPSRSPPRTVAKPGDDLARRGAPLIRASI